MRFGFRAFIFGGLCASLALWMLRLTQTISATQAPGSTGALVGLVAALQVAPMLVLCPVTGWLADRVSRVRLLLLGQLMMGGIALLEALRQVTGQQSAWQALVLATGVGVAASLDYPVRVSTVADLVPSEEMPQGISAVVLTMQFGRVSGPALCGLLLPFGGVAAVFAVSVGLFGLAAAGCLVRTLPRPAASPEGLISGVRRALAIVCGDWRLRLTFLFVAVAGLVGPNLATLVALIVRTEFAGGAQDISVAVFALAVGAVLGAAVAARWLRATGVTGLAAITVAGGAAAVLVGVAPVWWSFLAALVGNGACATLLVSRANNLVQVRIPAASRGSISALFTIALLIGAPVGSPMMGWLTDLTSARWSAVVFGGAVMAAALLVWRLGRLPTPRANA